MVIFFTLGAKLSEITGQEESIMIGLVGLTIKDLRNDISPQNASFFDIYQAFDVHLRERLKKMRIKDADQATEQMLEYLTEKQSLFVMSAR